MKNEDYLIERRKFLSLSTKAGIAMSAMLSTPSMLKGKSADPFTFKKVVPPVEPVFTSAKQLANMILDKKISSEEAVNLMFKRIEAVNPAINAVVITCPERALMEAKMADQMLAKGKVMGPLHGVPMTIKDSIDTAGIVTTGGTMGRKNYIPSKDATVVDRLRKNGAVLLGKTNTPEFTLSGTTANLIYGMTSNPYKEGYSPGGSSGGAGAIVAAGGSMFDIGSDFGGSIRGPAHFNGIAGLKPTTGRVPRTGHIVDYGGIFDAYQVLGPLARWVEDLKLIMPLIIGPDQLDAAIHPVPWEDPDATDISALQYAWFIDHGSSTKCSPETIEATSKAAAIIEDAGFKIKQDVPVKEIQEAELVRHELSRADGRAWVKRLVKKNNTLRTHPLLNMEGEQVSAAQFTALVEQLDICRSKMLQWMSAYDILICPVDTDAAQPNPDSFNRKERDPSDYGYKGIFNLTGWPAAVVRAGTSKEGLPIGVQIVGKPWTDHKVLAVAHFLEGQLGGWKEPTDLDVTVDINK